MQAQFCHFLTEVNPGAVDLILRASVFPYIQWDFYLLDIFWNGEILIQVSGTLKLLNKWKLSRLITERHGTTEALLGPREKASMCDDTIAKCNGDFEDAFSFYLFFCC